MPGQKIFVKKSSLTGVHTGIRMIYNGSTNNFEIPFSDRASVENAIYCCCGMSCFGNTDLKLFPKGLQGLSQIAMRMELKSGIQ